jgi:hypothetical protein
MGVLSPEDRMASSRRAFAQKSPHADEPKQHIVRALSQATSQLHIVWLIRGVPPKRRMDAASFIRTPPRPKEYSFTRHTYEKETPSLVMSKEPYCRQDPSVED